MTAPSGDTPAADRLLYEELIAFLREDGWPIDDDDVKERALAVPVEADNGKWICLGQIAVERPVLMFWSLVPTYVTPEARERVGEYLHRANHGLFYGAFQYDLDEGEVRFLTSLDFTGVDDAAALRGSPALQALIARMVYANVTAVDRYLPGLMAVIYAHASPAEEAVRADLAGG